VSRSVTGLTDPREREWPDEAEWCFEHGLLKESCGKCAEVEMEDATFEQLAAAFVTVLNRVQMADDETKGAALAARFDRSA